MGAPTALSNRNAALAAVAALAVAPLTQLGSLNALAPLSAVGLAGILFTALMMGVRYIDGSYRYSNLGGEIGRFLAELPTPSRPSFNVFRRNTGDWHSILSPSVFILLSMFNTAFVAHYHAPRIYMELREKTMEKFNLITSLSFGLSTAVFIFMMTVGFLTFGGNCHGFILSNYANSDVFASASRLAVGLTLLSGYPILFTALRDNLVDIFGLQGWAKSRPGALKAGSIALLFATTLLATRFRDVSFLVSFTGALCGSLLMFVFPALMSIKVESTRYDSVRNDLLDVEYSVPYWEKSAYNSDKLSQMDKLNQSLFRIRFRKIASYIMLFIGCVMAVAGVLVSTLRAAGVELGTS